MKKNFVLLTILCFGYLSLTAQDLKTKNDSFSYSMGVLLGENLKGQGVEGLNAGIVARAMQDLWEGKEMPMSSAEAKAFFQKFMSEKKQAQYAANKKAGEDFLKANAEREGVVTLPSGLQYEVLKEGTGPKPSASDKVTTHYHGTLINGDVFDSSVERGQPATFPVGGVILGWQEALQLMPVGSKWKLFIPYSLAYGEKGAGGKIKPYSTLIFEIELLEIN